MDNNYEQRISQLEKLVKDLTQELDLTKQYAEYLSKEIDKCISYTEYIAESISIDKEMFDRKKKLSNIIKRMKEI